MDRLEPDGINFGQAGNRLACPGNRGDARANAGGGGFPSAAKFRAKVSTVIANAAECEPLLHKDKELLVHHSEPFLRGMVAAMEMVGAREGVVGIKEKYHEIIDAIGRQAPAGIRVVALPDVN